MLMISKYSNSFEIKFILHMFIYLFTMYALHKNKDKTIRAEPYVALCTVV